jgi:hypothetical protein
MPWRGLDSSPGRSRFRFSADQFIAEQGAAAPCFCFSLAWRARLVGPSGPASLLLSGEDRDLNG